MSFKEKWAIQNIKLQEAELDLAQADLITTKADTENSKGANQISNFLLKCQRGENVAISLLGDSIGAGVISGGTVPVGTNYLIRLKAAIDTKYSITCTANNHSVAGYNVFDAYRGVNKFNLALANNADLYILSFGHNDIKSDIAGTSPYGYTKVSSITSLERMIRKIRVKLPNADIILLAQPPYPEEASFNTLNTTLVVYNNEMKKLANMYDILYVDTYAAYIAEGSWNYYINNAPNDTHPNEYGHELMFDAIWKYFDVNNIQLGKKNIIPSATYGKQHAYAAESDWVECTKDLATQGNKYYLTGAGWAQADGRWVTSTANQFATVIAYCSEIAVKINVTEETHVKIMIDNVAVATGNPYYDMNLQSGDNRYSFQFTQPGVHSVVILLRSGSLKLGEVYALQAPINFYNRASTLIAFGGAWSDTTPGGASSYAALYKRTTAAATTITFTFIGTGCTMAGKRNGDTISVAIDGGTAVQKILTVGYAGIISGELLASGLEYGEHTVVITVDTIAATNFDFEGFCVVDERRLDEPKTQRGRAVVGDAVVFPIPFAAIPVVRVFGNGVYPSLVTATGFTVAGSVSEIVMWEAQGSRVSY